MDLTLRELAEFVIKRPDSKELSGKTSDLESLNILMALYEPKKVEAVTKEAGYELELVNEKIVGLIKEGLVEVVDSKNKILEAGFIKYLNAELTKSVGPLASILIEDVADELGYEINFFPSSKADVLIDLLINEIKRQDQAIAFKRNTTAELKRYLKE